MKTFIPEKIENDSRRWVIIDAEERPLGRLAVQAANYLRGRYKPSFCPHVDTGDFVVVINAEKVKLTGRKEEQKIYQRYSGYRGGLKESTAAEMRQKHPDDIIKLAVRGMLPRNNQSRTMLRRLKVYTGVEHPHEAQNPTTVNAS